MGLVRDGRLFEAGRLFSFDHFQLHIFVKLFSIKKTKKKPARV